MSYTYEAVARPKSGLRLHLNENTGGCSPAVLDAIRAVTRQDVAFYPSYDDVVAACAARFDLAPDRFVLTNGLDEGILVTTIAALRDRGAERPESIVVVPAFDMYASTSDAVGASIVQVPLGRDFEVPVDAVIGAVTPRTRLLFLTSPNNPTGLLIPRADVLRMAAAAPHVLVFLDEAYADFAGVSLVNDLDALALPNLLVGRTFAKAYGIAGLRAGIVTGHPDTIARLARAVPPFSINACAAAAMTAGLADREYYDWYLAQVRDSKALLYEALRKWQLPFWESAANFVLVNAGDRAKAVVDGLAARGVHVRDRSNDPSSPGCIRITTGVVEHTSACIRALEEVLCGAA
jgi:histidinol-phosphate aminotransferase